MSDLPPVTQTISDYLQNVRLNQIPGEVRHEAKRAFLNILGVGIAGAVAEEIDLLLDYMNEMGTGNRCPVWGREIRVGPEQACLLHGAAAHVLDFDDTHLQAMVHPSPPLPGPIFAMASLRKISGSDALLSFLLGIEVEFRMGEAVRLTGFHPTAVLGNFGAAVATGKLLDLDAERFVHAFGAAATQAAGLVAMNGTMCKSFHVGKASMNGFLAAQLAARGLTSKPEALEFRFPRGYSTETNPESMLEGLGDRFLIHQNSYKPFACGVVAHPAIDGALSLKNQHRFNPDHIERIDCTVNPSACSATGILQPRDSLQARFSLPFSVAAVLRRGKATHAEYSEEAIRDPGIKALVDRVILHSHPEFSRDQARVEIRMKDRKSVV